MQHSNTSQSTSSGSSRGRPSAASKNNSAGQSAPAEKTICAVCQVISDNHHIHYGALACFSCRAFFRRAHGKGDHDPGYVCKKDGKCDITDKNRKKCQKCRYDKCLQAGMKPSQVLNADQKKVRFRKMLEKKGTMRFSRKRSNASQSQSEDEQSDGEGGGHDREGGGGEGVQRKVGKYKQKGDKHSKEGGGSREIKDLPQMIPRCSSDLAQRPKTWGEESSKSNTPLMYPMVNRSTSFGTLPFASPIFSNAIFDEDILKREILSSLNFEEDNNSSTFGRRIDPSNSDAATDFRNMLDSQHIVPSTTSSNKPLFSSISAPMAWRGGEGVGYPLRHQQQQQEESCVVQTSELWDQQNLCDLSAFHDLFPAVTTSSGFGTQFPSSSNNNNSSSLSVNNKFNISMDHFHAIIEAYNHANVAKVDQAFYSRLVSSHRGIEGRLDDNQYIKQVVTYLTQQFKCFANQFQPFRKLSQSDRHLLLVSNTQLFLHFVIGRYLSCNTGHEQLKWVMPEESASFLPPDLAKISIETTIFSKDFFDQYVAEKLNYVDISNKITKLELKPLQRPFIMALLLFAPKENVILENGLCVTQMLEELITCVCESSFLPIQIEREKCEKLFDLLHVINNFCPSQVFAEQIIDPESPAIKTELMEDSMYRENQCVAVTAALASTTKRDPSPVRMELDMKYTVEEEKWITHQMTRFHEAYKEVSLGEDLVNEFVMFTYDVPLSKHYIPSEISTFLERCKQIMRIHPEFSELSEVSQSMIWRENCFKAAALYSVKAETFNTGIEQLRFCLGGRDMNNFSSKFTPNIHGKLKKVLVTDWNRTSNAMDSDLMINYLQLSAKLSNSVEDLEMFIIIALMILFTGERARSVSLLAQLEKKYSLLFQRRVAARGDKSSISKVRSGVESVEELSSIFKRLHVF